MLSISRCKFIKNGRSDQIDQDSNIEDRARNNLNNRLVFCLSSTPRQLLLHCLHSLSVVVEDKLKSIVGCPSCSVRDPDLLLVS